MKQKLTIIKANKPNVTRYYAEAMLDSIITLGALPRMDTGKAYFVTVRGALARVAGVNYTNDEANWGAYAVLAVTPGVVLHTSTGDYTFKAGDATRLVQSFCLDEAKPLNVNLNHDESKNVGYIIGVGLAKELILSDGLGRPVQVNAAADTEYVLLKIAWLYEGYSAVSEQTHPYPSIEFGVYKDTGELELQGLALCTRPADEVVPALVMATGTKGEKVLQKPENKPTTKPIIKAMSPDSPIRKEIESYLDKIDDATGQAFLDLLKQAPAPETENPPEGGDVPTGTPETEPQASGVSIKDALLEIVEKLKASRPAKPVLAQPLAPYVPDDAEKAAMAIMLAKKMPLDTVKVEASAYRGWKVADTEKICAERFKDYKPPQLGAQAPVEAPATSRREEIDKLRAKGYSQQDAYRMTRPKGDKA